MVTSQQVKKEAAAPADHASYLRSDVVKVFGECPDLKNTFYVKRKHILSVYGISCRHFGSILRSGILTPKHFVFKQEPHNEKN